MSASDLGAMVDGPYESATESFLGEPVPEPEPEPEPDSGEPSRHEPVRVVISSLRVSVGLGLRLRKGRLLRALGRRTGFLVGVLRADRADSRSSMSLSSDVFEPRDDSVMSVVAVVAVVTVGALRTVKLVCDLFLSLALPWVLETVRSDEELLTDDLRLGGDLRPRLCVERRRGRTRIPSS